MRQLRASVYRGLREALHRHLVEQPLYLARVEHAGAEVLHGLGPTGHREAQAVLRRAAAVARRDDAREERVAGADRRARLDHARVDARGIQHALLAVPRERETPG